MNIPKTSEVQLYFCKVVLMGSEATKKMRNIVLNVKDRRVAGKPAQLVQWG